MDVIAGAVPKTVPEAKWSTVVLWPDMLTHFHRPEVRQAIVEALGYRMEVPDRGVCCGLNRHSTGRLDIAERVLGRTPADFVADHDGPWPFGRVEAAVVTQASCRQKAKGTYAPDRGVCHV
ncbi:hypothetical protein [Nocardiopsis sp. CC223A]|uniref:hypothetical protein n=1 Tax=Nocardiopsis sp. CC223A TaxID=3044051 RepID=UPI0027958D5F|nr:hypothetical protein [Nocardiopsis sp. CC223A]